MAFAPARWDTKMRRRAAARQPRLSTQYFFVRLSVSAQIPAGESKSLTQQKSPARHLGASWRRFFSRKALASAAREGSLAYGSFSRIQWRDRGRFSRPSPLPLPANWKLSVCRGSGSVNVRHKLCIAKSSQPSEFSDSSSSVCAFRPVHAAPLENPRGDRVH